MLSELIEFLGLWGCILLLIIGMILMIKGADFFVEGSSNVARALKIPSLVIGLTLVSIGTSAPELAVSVTSAIQGKDAMSLGNVIGSNIFNVLVVIGASALMIPLFVSKDILKKDIPILLGIYLLLGLFAFVIGPLKINWIEGIVIFALFFIYTIYLILRTKKENTTEEDEKQNEKNKPWLLNIIFIVGGIIGIILGGTFVVDSAEFIAGELGMSTNLISLTIVAVGTSLPELVTSIVAAKKGENDIAVGNAIGSSLFNIVLILGLSSIIYPVSLQWNQLIDFGVMFISVLAIFIFAFKSFKVNKWQGILLLACYIGYLSFIIIRN